MEFGDWGSDFGSYDYGGYGDYGGWGGDMGWGGDYGYGGWDTSSYDWGGTSSYDWGGTSSYDWGGTSSYDWGGSNYDWGASSYGGYSDYGWGGSSGYDWNSYGGSSGYDWNSGYGNYDNYGYGSYDGYNAQYASMYGDESRVWMDGKPLDGGQPTWPGAGNERFINDPLNMDMNDKYMLEYLRDNPNMIDSPYRDYYRNQIDQFLQDNQNGTDRLFPSPESPTLPQYPRDALPTGIG